VAVDLVVLGIGPNTGFPAKSPVRKALKVLLIQRGSEPYLGQWALPGGFVDIEESLENAAKRELQEETGAGDVFLEQLYTFGDPGRDPRERVISVAYYALLREEAVAPKAGSDASQAAWVTIFRNEDGAFALPKLAFDHERILKTALQRLQGKISYVPIGFEMLPRKFALPDLQQVYEAILGRQLDARNFRKKVLAMGIVKALDEVRPGGQHRHARLYQFDAECYQRMVQEGVPFEV
jgi:8-oxo-dGTP diphosphatase